MINMIDEEEFRGRLLLNYNPTLFGLNLKQFTIKEVYDFGEGKFNALSNFAFINIKNMNQEYKALIDDYLITIRECLIKSFNGVYFSTNYTIFDVICYDRKFNESFIEFLNVFTKHTISKIDHVVDLDCIQILYDNDKSIKLNRIEFNDMLEGFAILNFATGFPEENLFKETKKDEKVEEYEKELEELKRQFGFKEQKPDITFYSILEWLVNDARCYTHENIGDKTMYQVMSSFNRLNHIGHCEMLDKIRSNGLLGDMNKEELKKAVPFFEIYR